MFGFLFNLNFIEEIIYLIFFFLKVMKNMYECRFGLWGLDIFIFLVFLFVIENFILDFLFFEIILIF